MSSIITKKISTVSNANNANNLSNNLRFLMKKEGVDAAALSNSTGIALTTINGLKRGVGNPTLSTLQTIAEFFKITIGQLTETNLDENTTKSNLIEIPLLDIQAIPEFLGGYNKFDPKIAIEVEKNNGNFFAVKIQNTSMSPHFEKGTVFVISPELQPQDGDIALVQFNNQLPCFRKIFIESDRFIFTSVSEIIGSDVSKNSNYKIIGIVVKAIQNFHE